MGLKNKKVVAISASPSKGRNSDTMLDHFIAGFEEKAKEDIRVEKFYLDDIPFQNYNHDNKNGPQKGEDKFADLYHKFDNADAVIIATPTYNFSVPAQLKNFIDRIKVIALDANKKNILGQPVGKLKNKKMFFLVSGGTPKWIRNFIFFLYPGFWLTVIFAYYGAVRTKSYYSGNIETFKNEKILKKCFKKGKWFAKKVLR